MRKFVNFCFIALFSLFFVSTASAEEKGLKHYAGSPSLAERKGNGPNQYKSVTDLFTEFNDFPPESGGFKLLQKQPLSIQISPQIYEGELPEFITATVIRAAIYGAYRPLIHTDTKELTVTVLPELADLFDPEKKIPLKDHELTFSISKERALAVVQQHLKVKNLSEIIDPSSGTQFTKAFNECCYYPASPQTLARFGLAMMEPQLSN